MQYHRTYHCPKLKIAVNPNQSQCSRIGFEPGYRVDNVYGKFVKRVEISDESKKKRRSLHKVFSQCQVCFIICNLLLWLELMKIVPIWNSVHFVSGELLTRAPTGGGYPASAPHPTPRFFVDSEGAAKFCMTSYILFTHVQVVTYL